MHDEFQETTVIQVQGQQDDENKPSQQPEDKKPKKKKKRKLSKAGVIFFRVLLVISLCVATFSGYQLYKGLKQYHDGSKTYSDLFHRVDKDEEDQLDEINFDELSKINSDVVGWLSLQDTVINYPVVQGEDNDFYLDHLFTKEYNRVGCLFIDARNKADLSDQNTCIYGHHMRDGSMFAKLEYFNDDDWFKQHQEFVYRTKDKTYKLYPFAGVLTNGQGGEILQFNFENQDDFMKYVNDAKSKTYFKSDVDIQPGDKIVTLITCSWRVDDGRFALMCKAVEESEK